MASPTAALSGWDKLDLVPAIPESRESLRFAHRDTTLTITSTSDNPRNLVVAISRGKSTQDVQAPLLTDLITFLFGNTGANYAAWTKSQKLPYKEVQLSYAETKAFWVGDPQAENIVLYFHGGGWAMPATDSHFTMASRIVAQAAESGKSIAGLVIHYDLAPTAQYPHQLTQCVELLRYVLTDLQKAPHQIILGGDSSGGNLVMGVLSHILHPHPSIQPLKLSEPLQGAFLASPVVGFNFTSNRFRTNEIYEPAPVGLLKEWVLNYLGDGTKDGWNEPGRNTSDWWKGLERTVSDILMTVASEEVMADNMHTFGKTVKVVYDNLTVFTSKLDFHAEPGIGYSIGLEECEASQTIKTWVAKRLADSGKKKQ